MPESGFMARKQLLGLLLCIACGCEITAPEVCKYVIMPEQRSLDIRDPSQYPSYPIPPNTPPRTVTNPQPGTAEWRLSLDEAIAIGLANAKVVRILTGTTAVSSGQTIYDAAITNTTIDQQQATFDPTAFSNNKWMRTNTPFAEFVTPNGTALTGVNGTTGSVVPGSPASFLRSTITSNPTDTYLSDAGLTKTNVLGGKWALDWIENPTRIATPGPFPLNPETPRSVTLSYTQPLLQGGGFQVNMAPIVIARLNTEQSFFQYKDSVQELVRGTAEAYWNLVQARVNVWARKIQEQQSKEAFDRELARLRTGFSDVGTMSQTRVTYNQFRASRIAAEADVLTREGALRNLLGLPASDDRQIIPTSAPASMRLPHDWAELVQLAEQRRPDIVELKIVLEADQQRLIQAENQALPRLDTVALYRWNGLSGEMPNDMNTSTRPGQYTDWSISVNFSVPLGLRQGRALVRQQRLLIARDRANVEQQIHFSVAQLAATLRDLDSAYEQYLAYKETRAAADINLRVQNEKFRTGQTIYLNVLQALNDWGNAVSTEAQQLLAYNITLATLERQTGTILETHGLVFAEERFRAAGPLLCNKPLYPAAQPPQGEPHRYPGTATPSEDAFDLRNPAPRETGPSELQILPPPTLIKPEK
jgi:outer membrane protein TolC